MNTTVARLNNVVSAGFTMLTYCAAVMAATSFVIEMTNPGQATGTMQAFPSRVIDLQLAHPLMPSKVRPIERAVVKFDIDADFTPVFNWNTKQLYVFVVAEYTSKEFRRNEVTLWDHIVTSKDDAMLRKQHAVDYYFDDVGLGLRGANVTTRLKYHVMCHSGATFMRELDAARTSFIAK